MNAALLILWTLILVITVALVYISIDYMARYTEEREYTSYPGSTECTVPSDTVPSVANQPCCYIGINPTASRYSPELNMVVNPVPSPYLSVCQGYCTYGVMADGMTCIDDVGQLEFNHCINISKPINCTGKVMPVAYAGIVPYYPHAATEASCLNTGLC